MSAAGPALAALWANPLARKLILGAVAAAALYGAWWYVGYLNDRIDTVEAERDKAQEQVSELEADIERQKENAGANAVEETREDQREQETETQVRTIVKRVYRDREPTPEQCRAVLDPIADAFDGLRQLKADRAD